MLHYQDVEDHVVALFKENIGCEINLSSHLKSSLGLVSTKVTSVDDEIRKHHNSKTDVLVRFDDDKTLKISVKKDNADYYGNWYTHQRVVEEFGKNALACIIQAATRWANNWVRGGSSSFFVGVSINFGKRSGGTFMDFTDVLTMDDCRAVIQGKNPALDTSANTLLIVEQLPRTIDDVVFGLRVIDDQLVRESLSDIKIVFRPVNPGTEGTNRGKQTFTKFVPYQPFSSLTDVNDKRALIETGQFVELDLTTDCRLNHNRWLNELESKYSMRVRRKG